MLMTLFLVSLSMSDILEIDVATVTFLVLRINCSKIHTDSVVVISMTLLFSIMLNFTTLSVGN